MADGGVWHKAKNPPYKQATPLRHGGALAAI